VLVLERQTGRGRHSGVPLEVEQAALFSLRAAKIVRYEIYGDRETAMRAAGLEA
jgi:hypothetical protein